MPYIFLPLFAVIPQLVFVAAGAQSTGAGCAVALIVYILYEYAFRPDLRYEPIGLVCFFFASAIFLYSFAMGWLYDGLGKVLISCGVTCGFILVMHKIRREFCYSSKAYEAMSVTAWGMFALLLLAPVVSEQANEFFHREKAMVFYSETSHFTTAFAPFLLYMLMRSERMFFLASAAVMLAFFPSMTFIAALILILAFRLFAWSRLLSFCTIAVVALAAWYASDLVDMLPEYYADRITGFFSLGNLSAVVWVHGFATAFQQMNDTDFFGVGFQRFGINEAYGSETSEAIYAITGEDEDMNRFGGGTLAAKLIGEFGIFGLMATFYLLWRCARCWFDTAYRLRETQQIPLYAWFILLTPIPLFVRYGGYFSFETVACLVAHYLYYRDGVVRREHLDVVVEGQG